MANLTAPPSRWGTWRERRLGRPFCGAEVGGVGWCVFMLGGKKWGISEFPTAGVDID